MGGAADFTSDHKNAIQTTGGTIASIGLEQVGKKVAGALVTPATWGLNYAVEGSKPGAVDVGIWASGFLSAPAAIVTGLMKAFVDDDINQKLDRIKAKEASESSKFIQACYNFGFASPSINAMTVANSGGTAWISSIGLWVYITDARQNLVGDFEPLDYVTMYRPKKPYRAKSTGGFDWEVIRKKR